MLTWTVILVGTGLVGLWIAPRHWLGWVIYCVNEVLWITYGWLRGDMPILLMGTVWLCMGIRNTVVSRAAQMKTSTPQVTAASTLNTVPMQEPHPVGPGW